MIFYYMYSIFFISLVIPAKKCAWLWYLQQPFVIILCNSIGTPLDFKYIDLAPAYVAMTTSHIVVASKEAFYMWQFKNVKQRAIMEVSNRLKAGMEKLLTILLLIHFASAFIVKFYRLLSAECRRLSVVSGHSSVIRLIGVVSDHSFDV